MSDPIECGRIPAISRRIMGKTWWLNCAKNYREYAAFYKRLGKTDKHLELLSSADNVTRVANASFFSLEAWRPLKCRFGGCDKCKPDHPDSMVALGELGSMDL